MTQPATVREPWSAALRIPVAALLFLVAGAVVWARHIESYDAMLANRIWFAGLVLTAAIPVWNTVRDMLRGEFAADVVAILAIVSAAVLYQPFAGLVVVIMLTGGAALERYAEGRAGAAVAALEKAAPRQAHIRAADGTLRDVAAETVQVGDMLLVRPGELVPCDGVVTEGRSHVDASAITGEPLAVPVAVGSQVVSGSANVDGPLTVRATASAGESQYLRIVELVRNAQGSKAPLQRLADKAAVWFTPFTLAVCVITWFITRDTNRVLSVLMVATPCPLILATPIAIIGGINRCARRQVIIRTGGALEALASVNTAVFDKTGTLTRGQPAVERVQALAGFDEPTVLRLAAAVDYGSGHQLARPLVKHAEDVLGVLPLATDVTEVAGRGISGVVDGARVQVGSLAWLRETLPAESGAGLAMLDAQGDGLRAYVSVDGRPAGTISFADSLRDGLPAFFRTLGTLGITRTVMLSGDHTANVAVVATELGITDARGDLLPEHKVSIVQEFQAKGEKVVMIGDGTNDAPALATAEVGIALAGHGGGITAESADVVLLVDEITRVADAISASQSTMRIAKQSIGVGLGLSAIGMVFAALGYFTPTMGALGQEVIDVAVILNALRAARSSS
ncbi:MAG: heavy metal translocating P-type ATPase [Gemmatimonadaceae bacterium]|nr:heavy metal translocating P-type ATPase [Gemmatimonadaceae bacterium]